MFLFLRILLLLLLLLLLSLSLSLDIAITIIDETTAMVAATVVAINKTRCSCSFSRNGVRSGVRFRIRRRSIQRERDVISGHVSSTAANVVILFAFAFAFVLVLQRLKQTRMKSQTVLYISSSIR